MGLLYLVQERELLARSPRRFYYLIPSLERCDTIGGRSVAGGFGFLTLAIVTGFLWSHARPGCYWTGDPKEWTALVAWAIYVDDPGGALALGLGRAAGGAGAIAGFTVVVVPLRLDDARAPRRRAGPMIVVRRAQPPDRPGRRARGAGAFRATTLARRSSACARTRALDEAMILSTCNRVEVLRRCEARRARGGPPASCARYHGREPAQIEKHLYDSRREPRPSATSSASPPASTRWWWASRRSSGR